MKSLRALFLPFAAMVATVLVASASAAVLPAEPSASSLISERSFSLPDLVQMAIVQDLQLAATFLVIGLLVLALLVCAFRIVRDERRRSDHASRRAQLLGSGGPPR